MHVWTDEQWERAVRSGLLDRLPRAAWPQSACTGKEDDTDGTCQVRRLYLERHPESPAGREPEAHPVDHVWEEGGEWLTDFPPPPDFEGRENGRFGDYDYKREMTDRELKAISADEETLEAERAEELADAQALRDRYFGFTPEAGNEEPGTRHAG
jgi:hypothetical protein